MNQRKWLAVACVAAVLASIALPAVATSPDYWVQTMKDVHFASTNTRGAVARFGDSITYSGAFFKPLQYSFTNGTTQDQQALTWLHSYVYGPCWSWQDDAVALSNGNYSGKRSTWPLQVGDQYVGKTNISGWLTKLHPEMAVILFGTNDLADSTSATQYKANMRAITQACIDNGTIPILTTIPPRVGYTSTYPGYAQAVRDLSVEMKVPYLDYNQEILTRKPGTTWQNTLISSDGVHPSYNGATAQDFSVSSLNSNGYLLRNYVTMNAMYAVYNSAINVDPVQIKYTTTDLGSGKKGYSFYVNGLAGASNLYNINLAFTGNIGQQLAYGASVDKQSDADLYNGQPAAGYNKALDSYFYNPFAPSATVTQTVNRYSIAATSGSGVQNANLAYIATDGQVDLSGTITFNSKTYNISLALGPHSGDANNDGHVDVIDLGILALNYDGASKGWAQADYNGDHAVDVVDLGILALNYDWVAPAGSDGFVPEPGSVALIAMGGLALLRRSRRK